MRPPRGFTLLELLAALAVLAVLASLSFRGLSSVLGTEAHVREEARRWNEVDLLLGQLREDLSSAMENPGLALGASPEAQLVLTRFAEQSPAPRLLADVRFGVEHGGQAAEAQRRQHREHGERNQELK